MTAKSIFSLVFALTACTGNSDETPGDSGESQDAAEDSGETQDTAQDSGETGGSDFELSEGLWVGTFLLEGRPMQTKIQSL